MHSYQNNSKFQSLIADIKVLEGRHIKFMDCSRVVNSVRFAPESPRDEVLIVYQGFWGGRTKVYKRLGSMEELSDFIGVPMNYLATNFRNNSDTNPAWDYTI